jgi:hypothetical protein
MITCAVCRHRELEGELFCSECGARLAPAWAETIPTASFVDTARLRTDVPRPAAEAITRLKLGQLALTIDGQPQPVILEGRAEYILGREGHEQIVPDLNLNPYHGREKGVSRVHAALRCDKGQVLLIDLGSTNGTRLNGRTLTAHQAARVESGAEIRLGKLALRINFLG